MKELLSKFEPLHIIFLFAVVGMVATALATTAHAPFDSPTCRQLSRGNIQAYTECIRAERGGR